MHSNMKEEAIVTVVESTLRTTVGESLELDFVNVVVRAIRRAEYQDKICKARIKEPAWLSRLEPSAPLDGYLMEHGEFSASFARDDRIAPGLKVTVELDRC
ncbi:MAG: hypothetical protein JO232_03750 [Verrucomicrobia bacterium]|nr:hypothetical protein [Verrucomicrobiota bacterium]